MFVDVRLLGPLQVVDRSGQRIEVAGELPKALLAVLALGLRLAAHAAPVFEGWDPIAGASLFFGAGVTHTARIKPRTPEGEVYVTHPFAALAALSGDISIACQYVGTLPTAKGYGSLPLYALHQKV